MPINTGSFSFIAIGLGNWFLLFFGFADFFFAIVDQSVCLDVEAGIDAGLTLKTWLLVDGLVRVGLGCLTGIVLVSNYQQDRWGGDLGSPLHCSVCGVLHLFNCLGG
jgi:hypothetical protein